MMRLTALLLLIACQGDKPAVAGPYAAEVAKAIPQVEKATGLKFKTPPKVQARTRDELRAFLEAKFDEDQPALQLASEERAYRLFGLLPDTLKLRPFLLSLLAEQVVGYYDPATKVLYVVSGASAAGGPPPDVLNVTITHELVHALQDQYLALDSLSKLTGDNDRAMAAQAVIEGGATYDQLSVMLGGGNVLARMPGGWDRVRESIRSNYGTMPIFGAAPMFIQETLLFPYLSGAEFVRQFREKRPGKSPLDLLPVSTEQVMHPEKLLDTVDAPVSVTLPRPSGATVAYENGLGEFETRLLLHQQLQDVAAASRGATGWGGDRYMVVNTPQGAGIIWLSVWDTPFDGAEFRSLMSQAIEKRYGLKDGAGGSGSVLRYSARGRSVELRAVTVQGRATVMYTDVPAGVSTALIDPSKVTFKTTK
jgi:hypothetical protein